MQSNAIGWFEVPVTDMDRAIKFYETVLDVQLSRNQMGPLDMAWFPMTDESYGSAGSLVCHPEFYKPSTNGVVVYFTAHSGDLNNELSRVADAGGKVLQAKTKISDDYGFMALIIDSEGNRVALHSQG